MDLAPLAPAGTPYGSDENGLICGYRFAGEQAARAIQGADALDSISRAGQTGSAFVWLHFNLSHARAESWMQHHAGLPDDFFTALREGSRASRIHRDENTVFAVINDVTFDFSFDASDLATLWVSVRPGLVVTARRHPLRSVDRLRAAVKRGEHFESGIDLLDHLLRDQADELQAIVRKASERVDSIEDDLLARRTEGRAAELAQLRRLTVRLNRLMTPEPGALQRLLANPPAWVQGVDAQRLREAGDDFGIALRDVASLQDRIKLLQDEANSRVAEENNRTLYLLTMVTVLALPINLSSGLLGMNVGGIPLGQHPEGFWIVVVFLGAFTAATAWVAWRRLAPRG